MAIVCPNKDCSYYKKSDFVKDLISTSHKTGLVSTGTLAGAGWGAMLGGPLGATVLGGFGAGISWTILLLTDDYICTECKKTFRHSKHP